MRVLQIARRRRRKEKEGVSYCVTADPLESGDALQAKHQTGLMVTQNISPLASPKAPTDVLQRPIRSDNGSVMGGLAATVGKWISGTTRRTGECHHKSSLTRQAPLLPEVVAVSQYNWESCGYPDSPPCLISTTDKYYIITDGWL